MKRVGSVSCVLRTHRKREEALQEGTRRDGYVTPDFGEHRDW